MMNNLFSSFDPSSSLFIPLNWLIISIIMLLFPINFFLYKNKFSFSFKLLINTLYMEFSKIMDNKLVMGSMNMIISLFIFIMYSNVLGLFPFIFTSTSHLLISMMMAFSLWFLFFIFNIYNNFKQFMAHLIPSGTPKALMTFMVIIESTSLIIRPITLSVRLTANMIAGHLLLTLLGNSFFSFDTSYFPILYIAQIFLIILEMAVAFIQTYVFILLIILYSIEI